MDTLGRRLARAAPMFMRDPPSFDRLMCGPWRVSEQGHSAQSSRAIARCSACPTTATVTGDRLIGMPRNSAARLNGEGVATVAEFGFFMAGLGIFFAGIGVLWGVTVWRDKG